EIFDAEPEITDKNSPERAGVYALAPGRGPRLAVPATRGHLVFDHVSFSYPGAAEPVLRDIMLPDARPDARAHRGDRLGQVDPAAARAAARRRDLGIGPAGRGGRTGPPAGAAAPGGRLRLRGRHAVLRQRQGERDVRRAGRG